MPYTGDEVSRSWSLPARHTHSSARPLSIDVWAKGEVFPEALEMGGEDGQEPLVEGSRRGRRKSRLQG